uniref:Reverse transcriptase domain-containing protein n=1 Tax=Ananas comosus var. bracteatus TaxID=296719 RepID=A0A6V7QHX3_ANACO|nr:unnamed protein product [Ananas comosus var. bracteatus]
MLLCPIEIESFEEARPILLGEDLDHHLGLDSLEAQEGFIRQTGFRSVPAYRNQGQRKDLSHAVGGPTPTFSPANLNPVLLEEDRLDADLDRPAPTAIPPISHPSLLTEPTEAILELALPVDPKPSNHPFCSTATDGPPLGRNPSDLLVSLTSSETPTAQLPRLAETPMEVEPRLRPLSRPSTLTCTSRKLLFSKRSLRLAAKIRENKKSSLQKAQELKCKRIKLMNPASKLAGPSTSATPPEADSPTEHPPYLSASSTGAWVVLGDFNVLLSVQDKNGPTANINDILNFREVVQEIGFESYWLRHPAVLDVVATAWKSFLPDTDPVKQFSRKIESVQSALRLWSAGISFATREQGKRCLLWIEWLDKAEERRNKNFISRLSNGSATLSSPELIAEHLFSFFRNQLGVQQVFSVNINLQAIYTDEHVDLSSLHAPFTLSKVRTAVFSSAPEKAPRPDGLPMVFYQRFWNLIKDDIMGVFNTFYNGTTNLDRVNTGWLCLIPKKKEALSTNNFRPISLVHSVAKLISKVLASRLQIFLGGLINPHQAAFIKASTSVILNGTPGRIFSCKRGLRQGDPLSPLLFILCVDVLFRLLQIATIARLLPDLRIENARLHTLQFADDLIIFFDGSTRSAATIKLILEDFAGCSGLTINYNKSSVTLINLPDTQAFSLANSLGCSVKDFPLTYLGLPLSPKRLRRANYMPLIEKIVNQVYIELDLELNLEPSDEKM